MITGITMLLMAIGLLELGIAIGVLIGIEVCERAEVQ